MIGIVVSGHINFASGVKSAVTAIAGEQAQMKFVDFVETMSTDDLEADLRAAAAAVNSGEGVLFLTDIPGGSPSNRATAIMMDTPLVEVIGGANLPMIVNAAFERDDVELAELVEIVLEIGHSCIKDMRKEFEAAMAPAADEFDDEGL
ncbi:MAG: PTS sugar transporter subunit IIA [Moritella sp.]|uniref:PTS galactosamine/N-acetylgalactosamine transporter subunit IIA n=1 Tax=Moritella sp. TaxID=78556 RepID=UPI001D27CD49|nr:PTS galactosamine/N-acetylgalactosamine transporter subunit IIA [Moritella sp.]NQZ52108.1 PTS sugar transporter subunit IIA [Moritella sp.]